MPAHDALPPDHPQHLPEIEVDVEGRWQPGRLRSWDPRQDGLWADITYQVGPGQYRDRMLPAEQVRPPGDPSGA